MYGRRPRCGEEQVGISEPYYDLDDDWGLIVASFQSQYGVRLAVDMRSMSWREFSYLLSGLSGDTPLGAIVSIRAEKDPDRIKEMSSDQRRIRNEYLKKQASHKTTQQVDDALEQIKSAFIGMAKKK